MAEEQFTATIIPFRPKARAPNPQADPYVDGFGRAYLDALDLIDEEDDNDGPLPAKRADLAGRIAQLKWLRYDRDPGHEPTREAAFLSRWDPYMLASHCASQLDHIVCAGEAPEWLRALGQLNEADIEGSLAELLERKLG